MFRNPGKLSFVGVILLSFVLAAKADDASVDRLLRRGVQRAGRNDLEGAIADMSQCIELAPQRADAYMSRGKYYYRAQNYQASILDFSKVIELDPQLTDPWKWRGVSMEANGDLSGAIESYMGAIQINSQDADCWLRLGNVYRNLGKLKKSIDALDKSLEIAPNQETALELRGLSKQLDGDLTGSLVDLNEAFRLMPTADTVLTRYTTLMLLGNDDAAKRDRDAYFKLVPEGQVEIQKIVDQLVPSYLKSPSPKTSAEYESRGLAFAAAGYHRPAVCDFQKAIEFDDINTSAMVGLGRAFVAQGYNLTAIDTFKKCVEADDRMGSAYAELGEIYRVNLKQNDEALRWFDKAIELKYVPAYIDRGVAKSALNDDSGAMADLNKSIELNSTLPYAWMCRSQLFRKLGQPEAALADADEAVRLTPASWVARNLRAEIRRAKKDFAGAIEDYSVAFNQNRTARMLMMRGLSHLQMGNSTEAQKDFDEALRITPGIKAEMDKEIAALKQMSSNLSKAN